MKIIMYISNIIIPFVILYIVLYGYYNHINIYDAFVEGASGGLKIIVDIVPTLIGLMVSVGILRASGAFDIISGIIKPITDIVNFPSELVPLTLMRTVSASASTGIVLDLFKTHGPDSYIGRLASIMMGCTETIFYTMSVYFMSVKIKYTRYTLIGALLANIGGVLAAIYITKFVFGY